MKIKAKIKIFQTLRYYFMHVRALMCYIAGVVLAHIYKNKIPFCGVTIDVSSPEISPIITGELYFRFYENREIELIQKYLPDALDVIELGSSVGIVAVLARKRLKAEARLICVEAHPALVKQIEVNLKVNGLYHHVECIHKAVYYGSPLERSVYFTPGPISRMGMLSPGVVKVGTILVDAITLSEIIHAHHIDQYTLIADIEGVEAGLIQEDKEALKGCRHLFLELHDAIHKGTAVSMEEMLRDLTNVHGFRLQERLKNVVYLNRV